MPITRPTTSTVARMVSLMRMTFSTFRSLSSIPKSFFATSLERATIILNLFPRMGMRGSSRLLSSMIVSTESRIGFVDLTMSAE